MILKFVLSSRDHLSIGNPERHEKPEKEDDHYKHHEGPYKNNKGPWEDKSLKIDFYI